MTQGEKDTEETNDQDEQEHISPRVFWRLEIKPHKT